VAKVVTVLVSLKAAEMKARAAVRLLTAALVDGWYIIAVILFGQTAVQKVACSPEVAEQEPIKAVVVVFVTAVAAAQAVL
jgi:hypothetical protein